MLRAAICIISASAETSSAAKGGDIIVNLVKDLKSKHESVISNQIGRSGTSIGANIYGANYAQGRKDFISKLEIALKKTSETGYWLELLYKTNYIDEHML